MTPDEDEGPHESLEDHLGVDRHLSTEDIMYMRQMQSEIYGGSENASLPDNILHFRSFQRSYTIPFVVYADFESYIINDGHIPSGFCLYRVSKDEKYKTDPIVVNGNTGEEVMAKFYDHLMKIDEEIQEILAINIPMKPLTPEQQQKHDATSNCELCGRHLYIKYRDHDHLTGIYRRTLCNGCNLHQKPRQRIRKRNSGKDPHEVYEPEKKFPFDDDSEIDYFVPVVFHNAKGYDSHHILKYLKRQFNDRNISVIATNSEQFISLNIGYIRILDSCQFLPGSLDSLVETL